MTSSQVSVTAEEKATVEALQLLQASTDPAQVRHAYEAALQRWPHNLHLLIGLGSAAYVAGDRLTAAAAFRFATETYPDCASAFNNLASILTELGELHAAREAAQKAVALGGPWRDAAAVTLREIETAQHHAR